MPLTVWSHHAVFEQSLEAYSTAQTWQSTMTCNVCRRARPFWAHLAILVVAYLK